MPPSTQSIEHPALALLAHCRAIISVARQHRSELAGPKRLASEIAFLPAAQSKATRTRALFDML